MDTIERKRLRALYNSKLSKLKRKDSTSQPNGFVAAAFEKEFGGTDSFLEWWQKQLSEQTGRCYYCDTDIAIIQGIINRGNLRTRNNRSQKDDSGRSKNGRGRNLELDCRDPDKGYTKDNCVLACMYCNNDKSDIFFGDDYKRHFGENRHEYFRQLGESDKNLKQP